MFHDTLGPVRRFLQAQPWFASLSAGMQEHVVHEVRTQSGRKGETLLAAGTPVLGCYAVLSGLVKLQSRSHQSRQSTFLGVPAGEWFGEGSAMRTDPWRYDVIALRDSELLCLPRPVFDALRETSIAFNHALQAMLNQHLAQAMTIIEAGRLRDVEHRVAQYLSPLFWPGLRQLRLTQEELGHLAGLSRQTVNRVLRSLEQKGLVSLGFGGVAISDADALTAYLAAPAE
jgi:CRP/FNR family transcriptional regulator, cyclic AMP receptor protein